MMVHGGDFKRNRELSRPNVSLELALRLQKPYTQLHSLLQQKTPLLQIPKQAKKPRKFATDWKASSKRAFSTTDMVNSSPRSKKLALNNALGRPEASENMTTASTIAKMRLLPSESEQEDSDYSEDEEMMVTSEEEQEQAPVRRRCPCGECDNYIDPPQEGTPIQIRLSSIEALTNMGFSRMNVMRTLALTGDNVRQAAELLMEG
jgi:hypothetical protein